MTKIKRARVVGVSAPKMNEAERAAAIKRGRKILQRVLQRRTIRQFEALLLKEGSDEPQFTDDQITAIKAKADEERRVQEDFQKRKTAWRAQQVVDPKETTKRHYRAWKNAVGSAKNTLLPQIIQAFAFVEGAAQANDTLALGLEMKDASIDIRTAARTVDKLFNVAYAKLAVEAFKFPNFMERQIVERVIAREFPIADGDRQARNKEAEIFRALRELKAQRESMTEILSRQRGNGRPQVPEKQKTKQRVKVFDDEG